MVKKWLWGMSLMVAGGVIYLLFRPRTLLLFFVADKVGLGGIIDAWRDASHLSPLNPFLIYSLPCALWTASYLFLMDGLFQGQPVATRLRWASVIPAVGIVTELLQGPHLLPGTFDVADLLCYLIPYLLYLSSVFRNIIVVKPTS